MAETIEQLLAAGADDAPAISAPERETLTYGALRALVDRTVRALNDSGIGRGDAVAIVLPNGPEMAAAFVAIAAGATAAPLNPAYREDEFAFYLNDLESRLLIVMAGDNTPARAVAARQGIPIAELSVRPGMAAGEFSLATTGGGKPMAAGGGYAKPDDVALVLHTSGTTSRPKIVPLTQRNVTRSAASVGAALALTPADRCLNVMPLFHIHGLIAAVLSTLSAGAEICCTPGFNALKFFAWLDGVKPSWYTAVPTMHQAILARAGRNPDSVKRARLRFARSSSSSLPPQVMKELEDTFGCPVIEAYGMTEAAHQMASNPLPPRARKPGTVGVAAGPEIAIMDEQQNDAFKPAGQIGEVVIRGANVTPGYRNNPDANASSFTQQGWFRTGDQGVLDHEGYLTITGRIKELINRGGEKISPREVDEAMMDHPAVAQAVTFAMPHDKLGEEVAAAVVLREGQSVDERGLRDFVAARLADFKVPRKILFLEEIPKGATGKLQRIGLAKTLGLG